MSRYLFDYDDGDYCHLILDNMAVDSDGDMLLRIGNNMAMNMDSGEIHLTSSWDNDDEDDSFSCCLWNEVEN